MAKNPKTGSNEVTLLGVLETAPNYDHTSHGRDYYAAKLKVKRLSGTIDTVRLMIQEDTIDPHQFSDGELVRVTGHFHSNSQMGEDNRRHNSYFVSVKTITHVDENANKPDTNVAYFKGYICKTPVCRKTATGRKISDVILAIPRPSDASDYIPVLFWGDDANIVKSLPAGTGVVVTGRIQSRDYTYKKTGEVRTAYEVSIARILDTIPNDAEAAAKKSTEKVENE